MIRIQYCMTIQINTNIQIKSLFHIKVSNSIWINTETQYDNIKFARLVYYHNAIASSKQKTFIFLVKQHLNCTLFSPYFSLLNRNDNFLRLNKQALAIMAQFKLVDAKSVFYFLKSQHFNIWCKKKYSIEKQKQIKEKMRSLHICQQYCRYYITFTIQS